MGASREILAEAKQRGKLRSVDPATLETIAELDIATGAQVGEAVGRAREAAATWSATTFAQRARHLKNVQAWVVAHMDEIAETISRENGKPLVEAISADVMPFVDLVSWLLSDAAEILRPEEIALDWKWTGRLSYIEWQPRGVIGIIAPWNFPFNIPAGQTAMALMAGNTVVLKPSEYTPVTGEWVARAFNEAGLPRDVVQAMSGDGSTGAALVEAGVNLICFTGSVPTGKKIMAAAAGRLTPVCLELGGKAPMIVCRDANIEVASSAAVWGAFTNSGQVCASVERLYIHESIYQPFLDKVVEKTKQLRQGPSLPAQDNDVGPMCTLEGLERAERQVRDAREMGAEILTGGQRHPEHKGWFFQPTVLASVDHRFECVSAETFGPLLPVMKFHDEEEVVRLANDSTVGLTASIWSKDLDRARMLASRIEAGTVMVNANVYTYAVPQTPWGGPKESGIGRTHGALGLKEMCEPHHIHVNRTHFLKEPFWFRYSPQHAGLFKSAVRMLWGSGLGARLKALEGLLGGIRKLPPGNQI
ncbi:MAG: aldehyde dehydrogenase family protein [Deltaproteobacteria bacterium]|nr:aldehyde dehydrogenase family protein [Deltaproteobacteria bacterium]